MHATRHPEHPRAPRTSAEAREQLTPLARRGASAARIDAQDMLQPCHTHGTRRGARSTDWRPDLTRLHARGARGPLVARWRAGERGGRAESGVSVALRSSVVAYGRPSGGSRALSLEPRPADRARRAFWPHQRPVLPSGQAPPRAPCHGLTVAIGRSDGPSAHPPPAVRRRVPAGRSAHHGGRWAADRAPPLRSGVGRSLTFPRWRPSSGASITRDDVRRPSGPPPAQVRRLQPPIARHRARPHIFDQAQVCLRLSNGRGRLSTGCDRSVTSFW